MSKTFDGATAPTLPAETRLKIVNRDPAKLKPYSGNARTHSDKQIVQIAASIKKFGFVNPVLVDADGIIIAGHGRVEAAKQLGLSEVPTIELAHLTDAEWRAYVIADNRLAELAGWDREILAIELQSLVDMDLDFDLEITGFETAELDLLLDGDVGEGEDPDDTLPQAVPDAAVTQPGDVWLLGKHRLICGDAQLRWRHVHLPCIREAGDHPAGRRVASVSASNTGKIGHSPHNLLSLVRSVPC